MTRGAPARDRVRGALIGTFVGDSLGMPYEGSPPERIPGSVGLQDARLGLGTYTDDTQMMIALAESIIERDGIDEAHLAEAFLSAYEPARGYGGGTLEVFRLWRAGTAPEEAARLVFPGGSFGNGAAMRIAPVAVRWAGMPVDLVENAGRSARLTHAHRLGIDAAVVLAGAIAAALGDRDVLADASALAATPDMQNALSSVRQLLLRRPAPGEVAWRLGNSSAAHRSVPTAVYAAVAHESFADVVTFAVRCGGDTDTIAAMSGAIAGARWGLAGVPDEWYEALENGDRGRDRVLALADMLWDRARVDVDSRTTARS